MLFEHVSTKLGSVLWLNFSFLFRVRPRFSGGCAKSQCHCLFACWVSFPYRTRENKKPFYHWSHFRSFQQVLFSLSNWIVIWTNQHSSWSGSEREFIKAMVALDLFPTDICGSLQRQNKQKTKQPYACYKNIYCLGVYLQLSGCLWFCSSQ